MAGISSLGVGSGVLTADVIDQLKEADKARLVTPLENKVTLNTQKQDAFTLLSSLTKTLKNSVSALSYDTIFDNKTVDVSGTAEVSVSAGANVDSFSLETVTLAKKDITKLGAVSSENTPIASNNGVLKINGYEVGYSAGTTLSQLAQSITDTTSGNVEAQILETGSNEFSLVLSSKNTGAAEALTITDTDDGTNGTGSLDAALFAAYDANTNPTGYQKIQTADDATFKYNGITATRSSNTIDDLIVGVEITLKTEGETANVDIKQDNSAIVDEMQLLVDNYNTLMTNIRDSTAKNKETGAEGVFNGESFVKTLGREITKAITQLKDGQSLVDYGISLDRSGTMSFDKSVLEKKLNDDTDAVKLFFTGGTDANGLTKTGLFESLDETMKNYTGYGKLLSNFETSLKTDGTNLAESLQRAKDSLTTRYDILTKKFTAYDGLISKVNASFSSLQMMIQSQVNSSSN